MTVENNKHLEEIKLMCETVFALERLKSSCDAILEYEGRKEFKSNLQELQRKILIRLKEY